MQPDLIYYQAGVDPLYCDRLGHLKLTHEGLRKRNTMVYDAAMDRCIRTVVCMGGGYPSVSDAYATYRAVSDACCIGVILKMIMIRSFYS